MPTPGRPPKRRDDFFAEAQMLLNLARAIREDERRPQKWRAAMVEHLLTVQRELLKAPECI